MNIKVIAGVSALISLIYVVADEIAVNYMLAAANGATKAATHRPNVDLVVLRRQAQAALEDLHLFNSCLERRTPAIPLSAATTLGEIL